MRSIIWSIVTMAMCTLASCSTKTPVTKPNDPKLARVNQCSVHLHGKNTDLSGQDLERALTLLQHCLAIPSDKTEEDFLGKGDRHFPECIFYFKSTDSGKLERLYDIVYYGHGSRLMCVWGGVPKEKAFIADEATLKMVQDLVEAIGRNLDNAKACSGSEFRGRP